MARFLDIRKVYKLTKDTLIPVVIPVSGNGWYSEGFDRYAHRALELKKTSLVTPDQQNFIIPAGTLLRVKSFVWKQTLDRTEYVLEWINPLFKGILWKSKGTLLDREHRWDPTAEPRFFNYELEPVED